MPRSLRVRSDRIGTVKLALKHRGYQRQRDLSEELELALSTLSNFLNGKPIDRAIFEEICLKLDLDWQEIAVLEEEEARGAGATAPVELTIPSSAPLSVPPSVSPSAADWGEAPDRTAFFGRTVEQKQLEHWILDDGCRLILILGMGGAGKTALAVALAEHLNDRFERFIWRSLKNAPPLSTLLTDLISHVFQQQIPVPDRLDEQITVLMDGLRQRRCLVVLDNVETILQDGEQAGYCREGYDAYETLLSRIAAGRHQSCWMLTSREQPVWLTTQLGVTAPVRSLALQGLSPQEGQQLLAARGLATSDRLISLVSAYSGNPLALTIAAATIQSAFGGDIQQFLQQQVTVYGDIWKLLAQQFDRLSSLEQQVMIGLAVNRDWIPFRELQAEWIPPIESRDLLEAVEALQRRSLIETSQNGLTQQPVVMEYVTQRWINACYQDITTQQLGIFKRHALLKAQAQVYIRETQVRLIVQPLVQKLVMGLSGAEATEMVILQLLESLRGKPIAYTGYAAGNLINVLAVAGLGLNDRDFSDLAIAQADLTKTSLQGTNFTDASLYQSTFAETLGGIIAVAFSPNGQLLAASDTRGDIHIWQISSRQKLLTLRGHSSWVFSLVFSPQTITLASASDDYMVKLWDLSTGNCLQTLRGPANLLNAVPFGADEKQIVVDQQPRSIQLWNVVVPGQQIAQLNGYTYHARATAFSPDRETIAISTQNQTINIWNLETGTCITTFKTHSPTARLIAYSDDGRLLASTSLQITVGVAPQPVIQIWNVSTGDCLQTLTGHIHGITNIRFSPDASHLASSSFDQTVKVWNVTTGLCVRTFHAHNKLMGLAFSPDGRQLASGGDDHGVQLWDVATGQCLHTFQGYTNGVLAITLSPDRQTLATAHEDRIIRLWDWQHDRLTQQWLAHSELIWALTFAPTGQELASASADRTAKLWNLQTGHALTTVGHHNWVWSVDFHPDGQLLATGNYDETIKLWDTRTGTCVRTLSEHTSAVLCVCFSPDGRYLVSSSFDQTIRIWEVTTGACIRVLQGHRDRIWQVVFSPTGDSFASCSYDQTIKFWDLQTGACLQTLQGHRSPVTSIAFSPDQRTIASSGFDQTIRLWDCQTGRCIRTIEQSHDGAVLALLFQPLDAIAGRGPYPGIDRAAEGMPQAHPGDRSAVIISSSLDGAIRFWEPHTGHCWKTLRVPRPYEGMNLTRLSGLTAAQRASLKTLGAIELGD